jgi:hypothetical protein
MSDVLSVGLATRINVRCVVGGPSDISDVFSVGVDVCQMCCRWT